MARCGRDMLKLYESMDCLVIQPNAYEVCIVCACVFIKQLNGAAECLSAMLCSFNALITRTKHVPLYTIKQNNHWSVSVILHILQFAFHLT
jgi:hypothetical protein